MSPREMTARTAIKPTSPASNLRFHISAVVAAKEAFSQKRRTEAQAAVRVVTNMKIMGISVTQIYLIFLDLMMRVVPTPRAMAARLWLATPNMGQMVEILPEKMRYPQAPTTARLERMIPGRHRVCARGL